MMKTDAPTQSQREHERVPSARPVKLADALGTTRDVSASGVYFEIDSDMVVGSDISFEIALDAPGGPMTLRCSGRVVRIEQKDGRTGIAVRMTDSRLEAVQ